MFNTMFCAHCGNLINTDSECIQCGKSESDQTALKVSDLATPEFDRFDICAAYDLAEIDYNISGILQERKSNVRRHMSTGYQLKRMQYKDPYGSSYNHLSDNAKLIYHSLQLRYGFLKSKITRIDINTTAITVYRNSVKRTYTYSEKRANCIMAKTFSSFPYSRKSGNTVVLTTKNCFI